MTQMESRTPRDEGSTPTELYYGDQKVVRGKEGWLFLANDSNDVLEQHRGRARLTEQQLEQWRHVLETRKAWLEGQRIPYLFLVVPNAHSVYPEMLPDWVGAASEHRPVAQLVRHLEETGSSFRLLYPLQELILRKSQAPVYQRTDAHWNDLGAFVAYERLAEEIEAGGVAMRRLTLDDLELQEPVVAGDLGHKVRRIDQSPRTLARHTDQSAVVEWDNCVNSSGTVLRFRCDEAPPATCAMFGDSFAYNLLPFFPESFRRFTFVHLRKLDHEVVSRERPDVVVTILNERFLIEVPADVTSPSVRRLEHERREQEKVRFAFAQWVRAPEAPDSPISPTAVERIRAHLLRLGREGDATLVGALAYAGLRIGEALRLEWQNVTDRGLLVERRESSVDGAAASAHTRSVRLLRPLADDLERWRASRPRAGGLVFPSANGEAWTREAWTAWCESVFAPAVRACGADGATPQSLRRCFASLLLYEGMQLEEVARVIGGDPWWMYADFAYTAPDALRCERVGAEAQILRARELTARGDLGSAL